MAATGESYQQALSRLRGKRARSQPAAFAPPHEVDLIPIECFGIPLTLATFEILGDLSCVVLSGGRFPRPVKSPLFALGRQGRMS